MTDHEARLARFRSASVSDLLQMLRIPDESERAAITLVARDVDQAMAELTKLLHDPDDAVSLVAAHFLARIDRPGARVAAVDLLVLIVSGAAAGAFAYGLYAFRYHARGVRRIELAEDALVFTIRQQETRLPWGAIVSIRQRYHHGDFLLVQTSYRKYPHALLLEGYSGAQITRLKAALAERLEAGIGAILQTCPSSVKLPR